MVRSFDRRIESLFEIRDPLLRKQAICILMYNMKDNFNAYTMNEDSSYTPVDSGSEEVFNVQDKFFDLERKDVMEASLF